MKRKVIFGAIIGLAFLAGYLLASVMDGREMVDTRAERDKYFQLAEGVYQDNRNMQKAILELCGLLKSGVECHKDIVEILKEYPEDVLSYPMDSALGFKVEAYKNALKSNQ